jgi:hypothetical protein
MVTSAMTTVISAMAASITATRSAEADLAAEVPRPTGLRLLTFSQERAPALSVGLITAETLEAFPLAGGRVLEAASMEVVSMAAVGATR